MGCVYSGLRKPGHLDKDDTNHADKRIFDVVNVDDRQNEINHGQIRITDNDLIFDQKNKSSIFWPLRSLRRYGFDQDLFSFECGRRCTTGPGIYAFKCVQAEQLFNVLQDVLQRFSNSTNQASNTALTNNLSSPQHISNGDRHTSVSSSNVPSIPRISSPPHSYVNDIRNYMNSPLYVNTGIPNSVLAHPLPHMSALNSGGNATGSMRSASDINTNYAKLDDLYHYVNIHTDTNHLSNNEQQSWTQSEARTSVISVDGKQPCLSNLSKPQVTLSQEQQDFKNSCQDLVNQVDLPHSPKVSRPNSRSESLEMTEMPDPLNYVVLDLKSTNVNCSEVTNATTATTTTTTTTSTTTCTTPVSKKEHDFNSPLASPPPTPTSLKSVMSYPPRPYAQIDFDKTMALSSSAVNHRKI